MSNLQKKEIKMFDLKKGDKFTLSGKKYTAVGFIKKFMPTLGRVYNFKVISEDNRIQLFLHNYDVEILNP